ncbi:serine/threonine receptor-like kinase NFP [Typha latifolia]|uniref:serine/threonine receptor-like kinase NFP n=1 Tax=Typha latifolia TaxID=4733 RepID=UPI003C2F722D
MAAFYSFLLSLLSLLLLLLPFSLSQSNPSPEGFKCSSNRTIYPCSSYALFLAGLGISPLDLVSVGDLFDISRLMVARTSNLSISSIPREGQPLLIPLTCDCSSSYNHSYSLVQYQINAGDTFIIVSSEKFQNLTVYPDVEFVNPTLVPTNLTIGVMVNFPIFCQCPNPGDKVLGLVTYVFRPSDNYSSIASNFGTDTKSLISLNGPESSVVAFSTILVPMPQFPPPLLKNASALATSPAPAPSSTTPSVVEKKNDRKGVIIGLSVALGVLGGLWLLMLLLAGWYWRWSSLDGRKRRGEGGGIGKRGENRFENSAPEMKLMADISEWLDKYKVFQIQELRRATSDFDSSSLIQGTVYKGIIDGEVFAVKKMKWNACDELKILQKVNHTNLVKLEGFCIDPEAGTCYLVYEYVENGSLDSWLRDPAAARKLTWRARLRVALDLAYGLQYIHEHTWPRVVHKDIKTTNVLLDAKLRAKIANFGLAKTGLNAVTTHIIGTQGYIAPEYLSDGLVTTKMDVFAYGVVLLELVSGKEAMNEEGVALWAEAEEMQLSASRKGARVIGWMEQAIREQSCPVDSVVSVVNVAMACLQKDPSKRPSMVEVAYTLSKADEMFSDYSGDSLGSADLVAR